MVVFKTVLTIHLKSGQLELYMVKLNRKFDDAVLYFEPAPVLL